MREQLILKDCTTGRYKDVFPVTAISAIKEMSTGKTLDNILKDFNHIYLPFKDNSKANTRLLVPAGQRRKGLWITYTSCKDNVITEWYNSNDFSNKAWGDNSNWVPYLDKRVVREILDKLLGWYIA